VPAFEAGTTERLREAGVVDDTGLFEHFDRVLKLVVHDRNLPGDIEFPRQFHQHIPILPHGRQKHQAALEATLQLSV
jgi:hypothetical protein